jgi:hypothetical protein
LKTREEIVTCRSGLGRLLPVGPRSVLFGAHCFFIHPIFVAWAWARLYGFPWDPRLWAAFFLHDLGYLFLWCPNMDGPEGERHVEWGAAVMHRLFDRSPETPPDWERKTLTAPDWVPGEDTDEWLIDEFDRHYPEGWRLAITGSQITPEGRPTLLLMRECRSTRWRDFCLYHSRFYAKRDGKPFSRLCVADKLSVALEPWWLYLPRVVLSGEVREYMAAASIDPVTGERRSGTKYAGEPHRTNPAEVAALTPLRRWHKRMTNYLRDWSVAHRDGCPDLWTPGGV